MPERPAESRPLAQSPHPTLRAKWHHAPLHVFRSNVAYIVTGATRDKQPLFHGDERLTLLEDHLFAAVTALDWKPQAWSLFPNHYHLIATAPEDGASLRKLIQRFHSLTARALNALDGMPGRQVWFEYWDTCLTYEASYFARLNYVHNNPVKHGLVERAEDYPFCSAGWFRRQAEPGYYRKVSSFKYDKVEIRDDY